MIQIPLHLPKGQLLALAYGKAHDPQLPEWEREIYLFIQDWFDPGTQQFSIFTSGSTGHPKKITHSREEMARSASLSNHFFGIHSNSSLLLCIPVNRIGGRMLLLRAILSGAQLFAVQPSLGVWNSEELEKRRFDFCSLSVSQFLAWDGNYCPVKTLLLGGQAPSPVALEKAASMDQTVWCSFGMTETLSHVAMRQLNPDSGCYTALPGYSFSQGEHQTLIISYEGENLQTNDCVDLLDAQRFFWLGRLDFVINSGGLKLHPEMLERELNEIAGSTYSLHISAYPDDRLGFRPVWIFRGQVPQESLVEAWMKQIPSHHKPQKVVSIDDFPYTNGKIDRQKLQNWVLSE